MSKEVCRQFGTLAECHNPAQCQRHECGKSAFQQEAAGCTEYTPEGLSVVLDESARRGEENGLKRCARCTNEAEIDDLCGYCSMVLLFESTRREP